MSPFASYLRPPYEDSGTQLHGLYLWLSMENAFCVQSRTRGLSVIDLTWLNPRINRLMPIHMSCTCISVVAHSHTENFHMYTTWIRVGRELASSNGSACSSPGSVPCICTDLLSCEANDKSICVLWYRC